MYIKMMKIIIPRFHQQNYSVHSAANKKASQCPAWKQHITGWDIIIIWLQSLCESLMSDYFPVRRFIRFSRFFFLCAASGPKAMITPSAADSMPIMVQLKATGTFRTRKET